MSRRKSNIPTLLAARVRPTRRAPLGSAGIRPGAALRLCPGNESCTAQPLSNPQPRIAAARKNARRAADALSLATSTLDDLHARLLRLKDLMRPQRAVRRRSPRQISTLQTQIDAALAPLGEIIAAASFEGRPLLNGRWSITLYEVNSPRRQTLRLPSVNVDRLGSARVGFLSSTRTGGANCPQHSAVTRTYAIVRSAAFQVAQHRDTLAALSVNLVEPLLNAWNVATESADAAQNLIHDPDFAVQTSQLTQIDALLSMSQNLVRPPQHGPFPKIKLVQ